MKIIFVIDSLKRGGKERRLIELINNLPKNINFTILLLKNEIEFNTDKISKHVKIYNGKNNKIDKLIWFSKTLNRLKPDIVHSWYHECSQYSLAICKIRKIKFITSEITNINPPYKNKFSISKLIHFIIFKYANIVTSNSYAGLKAYNVPKKNSIVIHNGFDFKRIENQKNMGVSVDKNDTLVILMIANFTEKKDYATFMETAKNLLNEGRDLVFKGIGKGPKLEAIRNTIPSEYTNKILFPGYVENVEDEISRADIGVLTSYGEGFPNSIMEFMALKKPVIASTGGGTNELIDHNKTGFIVPQKNAPELQKGIKFLLDNSEKRIEYGEKGFERLKNNFSIKIMTDKFLNLYYQS